MKYTESGTTGRKEGLGRKSKTTAEVRRLADAKMSQDDETKVKGFKKTLLNITTLYMISLH